MLPLLRLALTTLALNAFGSSGIPENQSPVRASLTCSQRSQTHPQPGFWTGDGELETADFPLLLAGACLCHCGDLLNNVGVGKRRHIAELALLGDVLE